MARLHLRPGAYQRKTGVLIASVRSVPSPPRWAPNPVSLPVPSNADWHACFLPDFPANGAVLGELCRLCVAYAPCPWLFERVDTLPDSEQVLLWVQTEGQRGMRGKLAHLLEWDGELWLTPSQEAELLVERGKDFFRSAGKAAGKVADRVNEGMKTPSMRAFVEGPGREFVLGLMDINTQHRLPGPSGWPPALAAALRELELEPAQVQYPPKRQEIRHRANQLFVRFHPDRHNNSPPEVQAQYADRLRRVVEAREVLLEKAV